MEDSVAKYTFKLKQRKIPDSVLYAEDLLQFDSNEFLESYFGEKNVTKDLYYFSEKELKKCSVLFNGTLYQAAFVWGDENNLDNLSYIIVSNLLPTKDGKQNSIVNENNAWKFQNGIHHGMDSKMFSGLMKRTLIFMALNQILHLWLTRTIEGKSILRKLRLCLIAGIVPITIYLTRLI